MARYVAFISYSHADAAVARWLHRTLETYRLPRSFRSLPGGAPRPRLAPVFLDRAELASSAELAGEVQRALEDSDNLVVVCSLAASRSRWVNEEIRQFRALGRGDRIFCVIGSEVGDDSVIPFPPALSESQAGAPALAEPLAADLRASGDGRRDGFLKLVAGILGLRFDQLRQREQARRQRRLVAIAASAVAASVLFAGLASVAMLARREAEQQRGLAEQRSLTAERTTAFLQSLFEVSDPSEALGTTITAREVLDRGAERISNGLRGEPEVRATLMTTLGSVYASLGLYHQADDLLARAGDPAPGTPTTAAKLAIALGELRVSQGRYPAANGLFAHALESLRTLGAEGDADRARALIAWGESLATTDEFDAAREKIASGLAAARASRSTPQALIARGIEAQGLTALLAGELDAAEAAYREALAVRIAASGEIHPRVSEDLDSLGSIAYMRGDLAAAARHYERVLEINRKVFSPTHPTVAGTLNNLGRVQLERRRYSEARELLRKARDLMLAEHDATHDDMAFVFNNLALAEVGMGNDEAAAGEFAQAWAAADAHHHRMRAPILTDWADLDCRARRFREAEARLEQARPLLAEDYPDDPWRRAWLELVGASCQLAEGSLPAAEAALAANLPRRARPLARRHALRVLRAPARPRNSASCWKPQAGRPPRGAPAGRHHRRRSERQPGLTLRKRPEYRASRQGRRIPIMRPLHRAVLVAICLLVAPAAQAKRVFVDFVDFSTESGNSWQESFEATLVGDGSLTVPLGFDITAGGNTYGSIILNENGVVTFGSALPAPFQPVGSLVDLGIPVIAPYYADMVSIPPEPDVFNVVEGEILYSRGIADPRPDGTGTYSQADAVPAFHVTWAGPTVGGTPVYTDLVIYSLGGGAFALQFGHGGGDAGLDIPDLGGITGFALGGASLDLTGARSASEDLYYEFGGSAAPPVVPEPAAFLAFGVGLAVVAAARRRVA